MTTDIEPYEDTNNYRDTNYAREEAYLRAKKRLEKLTGFYWHLAVYVIVNLVLIVVISYHNSDEPFFQFGKFATAFFWGIGLFFHFIGVFGANFLFGKNWEARKIQEIMDKDQKRRWE